MSSTVYKTQEIRRALEKAEADPGQAEKTGFVITGSKHIKAEFFYKGEWILSTYVAHSKGDLPPGTQNKIRKQLELNRPEFGDFIGCPMKLPGLVQTWKDSEVIKE